MLKIKDKKNLEDLEKFGFEKCGCWYRYEVESNICIGVSTIDNTIQFAYTTLMSECGYTNHFDILFDLIQARYIEKVKE